MKHSAVRKTGDGNVEPKKEPLLGLAEIIRKARGDDNIEENIKFGNRLYAAMFGRPDPYESGGVAGNGSKEMGEGAIHSGDGVQGLDESSTDDPSDLG